MTGLGDLARGRDMPSWLRGQLGGLNDRIRQLETARQPAAGNPVFPQVIRQFNGNVTLNGSSLINAVSQTFTLPVGYSQVFVWATYMLWGTHGAAAGTATLIGQIDISTTPPGGSSTDDICPSVALDITSVNASGTLTVSHSGLYTGLKSGTTVWVGGQTQQTSNFVTSGNTAQLNGAVLFMR